MFLCDLNDPTKATHVPGGYFMAPEGDERVGDVSNVVFSNGWVARPNGDVFIYYGASDTRTNVATSTVDKLLDYVINTPPDGMRSKICVDQRCRLIEKNLSSSPGRRSNQGGARSSGGFHRRCAQPKQPFRRSALLSWPGVAAGLSCRGGRAETPNQPPTRKAR
jgi:hypothetical protein